MGHEKPSTFGGGGAFEVSWWPFPDDLHDG
jgi:hypothetical protein